MHPKPWEETSNPCEPSFTIGTTEEAAAEEEKAIARPLEVLSATRGSRAEYVSSKILSLYVDMAILMFLLGDLLLLLYRYIHVMSRCFGHSCWREACLTRYSQYSVCLQALTWSSFSHGNWNE